MPAKRKSKVETQQVSEILSDPTLQPEDGYETSDPVAQTREAEAAKTIVATLASGLVGSKTPSAEMVAASRPSERPLARAIPTEPAYEALSFYDPALLSGALSECGWTIREKVGRLVELARNDKEKKVALMAIKQLDETIYQAVLASGLISTQKTRITQGPGGRSIEVSMEGHGPSVGSRTLNMLRAAFSGEAEVVSPELPDELRLLEQDTQLDQDIRSGHGSQETHDGISSTDGRRDIPKSDDRGGNPGEPHDAAVDPVGAPSAGHERSERFDGRSEEGTRSGHLQLPGPSETEALPLTALTDRPDGAPSEPRRSILGARRPTKAVVGGGLCGPSRRMS